MAARRHPHIRPPYIFQGTLEMCPRLRRPDLSIEQRGDGLAHVSDDELQRREAIEETGSKKAEEVQPTRTPISQCPSSFQERCTRRVWVKSTLDKGNCGEY